MKNIVNFLFISIAFFIIFSCKTTQNSQLKTKFKYELLYRVWDVDSIIAGGRGVDGEDMGNPQYEFTKDGQRIKSYKVPPHSESVPYFIRNDSIHYSGEKPLPSSAIIELNESRLILKNDKALWKLYVK